VCAPSLEFAEAALQILVGYQLEDLHKWEDAKKMKTIYAFVLFVLVLAPTAAKAADHCTNEAIEPLVSRLAQA